MDPVYGVGLYFTAWQDTIVWPRHEEFKQKPLSI